MAALSLTLHFIILLSSSSCACTVAVLYAHPLGLLPTLASCVRQLGSALRAHLAHPLILFGLLNLLVLLLYLTSRTMPPTKKMQAHDLDGASLLKVQEESSLIHLPDQASTAGAAYDEKETSEGHGNGRCDMQGASNMDHDDDGKILPAHGNASAADETRALHSRLKTQTRKSATKRRSHQSLARSKSDGIMLLGALAPRNTPLELRTVVAPLKKAATFESISRRRGPKRVVVVADWPEEAQVAEEEVDKKAADFIERFYERVRLQR